MVNAVSDLSVPEKGSHPIKEMTINSLYIHPKKKNNENIEAVIILGHVSFCIKY